MHKVADLHVKGKSPQQYVDEVINALPEWGKSHHSIVRLGDQAALFAEAAPDPFLRALESMLEGAPEEVKQIFESERERFFGPSSPHVHFLWALEVIAWDPRYLNRAVAGARQARPIGSGPGPGFESRQSADQQPARHLAGLVAQHVRIAAAAHRMP
jgi:hypothetical protein